LRHADGMRSMKWLRCWLSFLCVAMISTPLLMAEEAVDLTKSIERTTEILDQINNQEDLERLEQELKAAWGPIAEMMEADLERALDRLNGDPALQPALQKQTAAAGRLTRRNPEVAENARKVMLSEEVIKELEEMQAHAVKQLAKSKARLSVVMVQMAIQNFTDDHNRVPFHGKGEDVTMDCDKTLVDILNGNDVSQNLQGRNYLGRIELKDGGAFDPWGRPLRVVLDVDGDSKVTLPEEYGRKALDAVVLVDSAGPDGDFKTVEDNLTSWSE
ncbi:MAG: hypothetical protein R3242_11085, partial [Akkermansiaceae bacterium]|nr:hypothetical protein [Akkermansiaceae bacterium]